MQIISGDAGSGSTAQWIQRRAIALNSARICGPAALFRAYWAVERKILPLAGWLLLLRFRAGRKYNDAYLRTLRLRWRFVVRSRVAIIATRPAFALVVFTDV